MAWMTPEPGYRPRRGEPLVPYAPDDDNAPMSSDDARLPEPSLPRLVASVEERDGGGTPPSGAMAMAGEDAEDVSQRQPASSVDLVLESTPVARPSPRPRPAATRQAAASREPAATSGPRNLLPWLAGMLVALFALVMWRGTGSEAAADDGPYPAGVQGVWERVTPDFEGQYLVLTTDSVVVPATLQRNTGTFPVLEVSSTEAGREISVVVRFRGPSGEETLEFLVDTPPVTVLRFRQPEGMLWKRVKSAPASP